MSPCGTGHTTTLVTDGCLFTRDIVNWHRKVYKMKKESDLPSNWRQIRKRIIERENYLCFRCDKKFSKTKLTIHHIVPRAKGGSHDDTNLIPLCIPCHDYVEINELETKADIMGSYDALDRKSTRLNSSHSQQSRMPSSA